MQDFFFIIVSFVNIQINDCIIWPIDKWVFNNEEAPMMIRRKKIQIQQYVVWCTDNVVLIYQ